MAAVWGVVYNGGKPDKAGLFIRTMRHLIWPISVLLMRAPFSGYVLE